MSAAFVAGAGTDVGKTYVACHLVAALRARGVAVEALKPVVSGFDPADWAGSDPGRLLAALGRPLDPAALEQISPWRYTEPVSPDLAAELEGARLECAAVAAFCRARLDAHPDAVTVVEGAGGVMSPVDADATSLDLMAAIGAPVVLVGGSYLGAISHTLTAVEAVRGRGLRLIAVVVSESEAGAPFEHGFGAVARRAGEVAVIAARRGQAHTGWREALADRLLAG